MKLTDLKYLKSLEKTKNYTNTAKEFRVSQPIISIAINRLEDNLNVQLVFRSKFKNNIEITKNGYMVIKFLNDIEKEISLLIKKLEKLKNNTIYLGVPKFDGSAILKNYLPNLFSVFKQSNNILYLTSKSSVEELDEDLVYDKIQYKIGIYPSDSIPNSTNLIKKILIKKINFCIIKNIFEPKILTYADISKYNIVLLNKSSFQAKYCQDFLEKYNISPNNIIYVDTLESAQILIESGLAIGIFFENTFDYNINIEHIYFENLGSASIFLEHLSNRILKDIDTTLISLLKN